MKPFAREAIAAQTARPGGVAGARPCKILPMFELAAPGQPASPLDPADLKLIAEMWGTTYADNLIGDARWPTCRQNDAIAAAEAIVRTAIIDVAVILNTGADFRPHISMMSSATLFAFQNSMPNPAKRNV
jgi:hypothetical protein